MRIVLCDQDALMRDVVESLITSTGHELAGVADATSTGVRLIEAGRPDAVILDLSLGFNTDFDIIASAIAVGARPIVFSRHGDAELLGRYPVRPLFVPKPDLAGLEAVLRRLEHADDEPGAVVQDRRQRPGRAAAGPVPTGVSDAQAFFEAINEALPGDAMVSIDVAVGAEAVAAEVTRQMRGTDRLLASPTAVRVYLPAGGEDGIRSLLQRVTDAGAVPADCRATSITVGEGELGADAFDRLKHHGDEQVLSGDSGQ